MVLKLCVSDAEVFFSAEINQFLTAVISDAQSKISDYVLDMIIVTDLPNFSVPIPDEKSYSSLWDLA